jgi:hypothetical protein
VSVKDTLCKNSFFCDVAQHTKIHNSLTIKQSLISTVYLLKL